jgi:hypothetical protein
MAGESIKLPEESPSLKWLHRRANWFLLPSWVGSFLFHLLLALLILTFAPYWGTRGDTDGDGGDSFRQAGIRLLPPGPAGGSEGTVTTTGTPQEEDVTTPLPASVSQMPPNPQLQDATSSLESLTSARLNLPQTDALPPVIGPGVGAAGLASVNLNPLVKPTGVSGGSWGTGAGSGGGEGDGGGGGTSFMGVTGKGKTFVYVIDRSFSMAEDNALTAAKLELMNSLNRLNETQQFQVIFYNNEYTVLSTRGGRFDFFRGTDAHRFLVSEQIRSITPAAGTRHLPPLLEALNFKPDVIFLLTDGAAENALSAADLNTIRQRNRHGTHIHCIEFGRLEKSPMADQANFLKTLARENGGQYVFRNLKPGF